MTKGRRKVYFWLLMAALTVACSLPINASQVEFLNMIGPTNVAVGKVAVTYNFS